MSYDALVVALREIVRFAEQSCRPGATTTNILQRERQIGDRLPFAGPFEKRLGGWRKSCSFTRGSVSGLALYSSQGIRGALVCVVPGEVLDRSRNDETRLSRSTRVPTGKLPHGPAVISSASQC